MSESRTQKSIQNVTIVLVMQIINTIAGIISRTAFVYILGNEYLSINGLFSNILTLLSFAELGIGNAIIFSLYKPIAEDNFRKISAIMHLLRNAYKYIIGVVLLIGLCILPFLKYIITDISVNDNLYLIYILFLINSASTYVLAYNNSLIIADQRNYIIASTQQIIYIFQVAAQILFLWLYKNYILYLIIGIASNLLCNIICNYYAKKRYSFLNRYKDERLSKEERKNIFSDVKSLFVYKIGAAILNGTDNIIVSAIIKTTFVGICSNYTLVINTINTIVMQASNSIVASIGNHNVVADDKSKEKMFRELNSVCFFIFSFTAICLAVLLNPLIVLWFGNDYILSKSVVISLVLAYYFTGTNQIASLYRTSMGMFKNARLIPFFAAIINIILSLVLGKAIGLAGVFYATSISRLVTFSLFDPLIIYKWGFHGSVKRTFVTFILRTALLIPVYMYTSLVISLIRIDGIIGLLVKTIVCMLLSAGSIAAFLGFNSDFRCVIKKIFNYLNLRRRNCE